MCVWIIPFTHVPSVGCDFLVGLIFVFYCEILSGCYVFDVTLFVCFSLSLSLFFCFCSTGISLSLSLSLSLSDVCVLLFAFSLSSYLLSVDLFQSSRQVGFHKRRYDYFFDYHPLRRRRRRRLIINVKKTSPGDYFVVSIEELSHYLGTPETKFVTSYLDLIKLDLSISL